MANDKDVDKILARCHQGHTTKALQKWSEGQQFAWSFGIQDGAFSADLISGGELLAYIPNFCLASGAPICVP
jgi:hypothetical protein